MECLVGIDFGTTNVKCVAYDLTGRMLARSAAPTPVGRQAEGEASYEPDQVWAVVARLLRETLQSLPTGFKPAGVAVASVGESVVPLDGDGKALSSALAWFDARPEDIAVSHTTAAAVADMRRVTGVTADHTLSAFKVLWFKRTYPDLSRRVRAWLPMADYIAFRLSGKRAVSLSLASRTGLMDLARCAWSEKLFGLIGLDISQWPELAPGGTRLGGVTTAAARDTDLPEECAVAVGGHDHLCGALAVGAIEPGMILDSMGTTEAVLAPLLRPLLDETLAEAGFSAGCHAARGRYYVITGITASGGLCAWLRRILFGHVKDDGEAFRLLEEAAASSPPGANGVRVWPCFAGANPRCPGSPEDGQITELTTDHTAGDIARAALESLSGEFAGILRFLEDRTGDPAREILVTGGGAANALWRQIKADMIGRRIVAPEAIEAGCLGAAVLGGVAAGVYTDEQDALRKLSISKAETLPKTAAGLAGPNSRAAG